MSLDEENITEGIANAIIKNGSEYIKKLAQLFRDRKIAFVQDTKTIDIVKEEIKSNELAIYKKYVGSKELLNSIIMGLTLRRLEENRESDRIEKLKIKISLRHDICGVHVAQAVQSGILLKYINYLIEVRATNEIIKQRLNKFLLEIDNHVYFVKHWELIEKEAEKVIFKINVNSPDVFVISGMGSAVENASELIAEINKVKILGYYQEDYSKPNRRIAFFHKTL